MHRLGRISGAFVVTLSLGMAANAAPPTRTAFEFDVVFQSGFLTAACGTPVTVHQQGAGTTTLFYDNTGAIIRELDTLAPGFTSTYCAQKCFTQVTHSPSMFLYPEGADLGDPAIVILNGVQFTSGPGQPRVVGREVWEGTIFDFTPEGVPIVELIGTISQSGQFDVASVLQARCAILTEP